MLLRETLENWINAYAQAVDRFRRGVLEAISEFHDNAYLPRLGKIPEIPPRGLLTTPDTS